MAVFRVERTQNYTVMSNYHLRDRRLSLKAKGLLSLMLSLPEDWDYTLSGLARISLEGKDAIRAAVVELEQAGYVQRLSLIHIFPECPLRSLYGNNLAPQRNGCRSSIGTQCVPVNFSTRI